MSLFGELKRRNVFRVATAYIIVGWLVTEVSTTVLPTFGAPDWVAKVLIFIVGISFIPVLIFSWAYEMTPEGLKREKDVNRDASITSATGKKLDYVTIAAVIAGVAFLVWGKVGPDAGVGPDTEVVATVGTPSVAVLPFVNMSGNPENEYFSDGLTETLLHMLVQIPDLRVAARTSSFAFKGEKQDIRAIADALDVAHILEGSVQRAGDRVRITAQLIRADDGFHVWSENYDRTLDDIFAIQDEIAEKVGAALSESLLGARAPVLIMGVGTENLRAYDLYLQALAEAAKGSYGSLKTAEGMLKDALGLDPGFDDAKIMLARGYMTQSFTGLMDREDAFSDAIALLEQVLAKRPDDVYAQSALFYAELASAFFAGNHELQHDYTRLLEELVDENPNNNESAMLLARAFRIFNRAEEALALYEVLVENDPLNPVLHYELSTTYSALNLWQESRESALRSLELEPMQPNALGMIARADQNTGDGLGYLKNYIKAMEVDPKDHELPGWLAIFLYDLRLPEEAAEFRARVMTIAPSSPTAYRLNLMVAEVSGDLVAARTAARKAIEDDVAFRMGAYSQSVDFLIRDGIDNGSIADVMDYLETTIPALGDFEVDADLKYAVARFAALAGWHQTLPIEEVRRRADVLYQYAVDSGFDIADDPGFRAYMLLLQGNTDEATEVMVQEVFTEPLTTNLVWREGLSHPMYDDIVADPRVQEEMQRWEAEEVVLRQQIRDYLASRN